MLIKIQRFKTLKFNTLVKISARYIKESMSKNGSSAVIEQTVLIIEKIFASQKVEIFIESHMEFNNIIALSEHNIYPIDNKSGLKLGEVNLKHVNLSEANIEVLNLLLSAMVEHLDCLDNCTKLELHQVNMANILFATNNELEDVYEDLNLAHEELTKFSIQNQCCKKPFPG